MRLPAAFLLLIVLVVSGCDASLTPPTAPGGSARVESPAPGSPGPSGSAPTPNGPLPIVFDTDMGMDDLLALYLILRDPALDVRAIAIDGTGLVHCGAGIRNMRRILGAFDRLDIPFGCGREEPGPNGRSFPDEWRASADAMYDVVLPAVVAGDFPPDAVTVLRDAITTAPEDVTVLAVGSWTNLQDLFAADPALVGRIRGIHAMAGTIDAPGNIELGATTPADQVEWNVGADPDAAAAVMALDVPVSLVPLDATNDASVPRDILGILADGHAAAGADIAYETYARRPYLSGEGNYWWDATAAMLLVQPDLGTWEDMTVAVNTAGPAAGRIARDAAGRPVKAAMAANGDLVRDAILAGLRRGAPRPEPFRMDDAVAVTWDGTACRIDGEPPTKAGLIQVTFANRGTGNASLSAAGFVPPRTWTDVLTLVSSLDLSATDVSVPDWIVQIDGQGPSAQPGGDAVALIQMPAGPAGLLCVTGDWPNLTFMDGGSFTLAE